jgi:hypothetical protein
LSKSSNDWELQCNDPATNRRLSDNNGTASGQSSNQSNNQSIKTSINPSINQSINQSINESITLAVRKNSTSGVRQSPLASCSG